MCMSTGEPKGRLFGFKSWRQGTSDAKDVSQVVVFLRERVRGRGGGEPHTRVEPPVGVALVIAAKQPGRVSEHTVR